jgi:hypothetical protein
MSVVPYPGFLFVDTICELAGADVTKLNQGCLAYVGNEDAYFRLTAKTPPVSPNGVDVISVPGGPQTPGCPPATTGADVRRWILTNIADAIGTSANSLAWYVNAVSGNDANIGTDPLFPVKTVREVGERWERGAGYNTAGAVHVYIQSDHLLPTDTILVKRPVVNGNPIIFHGTRASGSPPISPPIVSATDIHRPNNQIVTLAFAGPALPAIGSYIHILSGPLAGYWARIAKADPTNALARDCTPFVIQPNPSDAQLTIASSVSANVPGASYEILHAGCSIPETFVIDIDPLAEVWFYDVKVQNPGVPPNPFYQPIIKSGAVRFFRSEGDTGSPATFIIASAGSIYFSGSTSEGFVIHSVGEQVEFDASYADLPQNCVLKALTLKNDTLVSPAWSVRTEDGQLCILRDVAVNGNGPQPTFFVGNAILKIDGALYGKDNIAPILKLRRWARGSYADQASLTIAKAGGAAYSGEIDFGLPAPMKTFDAIDIPFVSIATGNSSQAGLIEADAPSPP